jgi:hypothetical protein
MRCLLLLESFDLLSSNQYVLVTVFPSCFGFAPGKTPVKVQFEKLFVEFCVVYMDRGRGEVTFLFVW